MKIKSKVRLKKSNIHGTGAFAIQNIAANVCLKEDIDIILASNGQNFDGFNHSCAPNVIIKSDGDEIYFFTIRKILKGEELTVKYINVDFKCLCSKCNPV